jgi:Tol biopolymer transport system component
LANDRQAYYAAGVDGEEGPLVFLRGTTLMAQPFDLVNLTLRGDPVPVAEGVDSFAGANYGLFSISDTGALVYRGGAGPSKMTLAWMDAAGNPAGTIGELGEYANPAISPDGSRIAVGRGPLAVRDIWILDVARGMSSPLTFDRANDDWPIWSPDSKQIVFLSQRNDGLNLYIKPVDGSAEERLVSVTPAGPPTSWSKDGHYLLFGPGSFTGGGDISALPDPRRDGGNLTPLTVLKTQSQEGLAQFSPDATWIAYSSSELGVPNIWVRRFSPTPGTEAGGPKWQVSSASGLYPRWSRDGKQLFYVTLDFQVMVVDVDTRKSFEYGTPRRLFPAPPPLLNVGWDLAPDGKRFLFVTAGDSRPAPFTVVLNWSAALKR